MTGVDSQSRPRAIHLFAGAGGGVLGGMLCGWRTVCAVELDMFCREVLVARQNDGSLDPFPIWDDIRTFDGRPWKGRCDVLCGGFPCQSISPIGKRTGIRGEHSCLWFEMARLVGEIQPTWVFIENSSDLIKLGLDVVLSDLDACGYDAEWECLSAAELGAPHIRDRVWVLARKRGAGDGRDAGETSSRSTGVPGARGGETAEEDVCLLADADEERREEHGNGLATDAPLASAELPSPDLGRRHVQARWWANEPDVRRVADGVANGVERLEALGNGQVAYVAERAFRDLERRFINLNRPSERNRDMPSNAVTKNRYRKTRSCATCSHASINRCGLFCMPVRAEYVCDCYKADPKRAAKTVKCAACAFGPTGDHSCEYGCSKDVKPDYGCYAGHVKERTE